MGDGGEDGFETFDGALGGAREVADQGLADGTADAAGQHPVGVLAVADQPHGFGQAGRLPLDDRPGALGREVPGAEAGAAGGDDEAGEAVGQSPQGGGDGLHPVLRDPVLDDDVPLAHQALGQRPAGGVVAGAGDDSVRHCEHFGEQRHDPDANRQQNRPGCVARVVPVARQENFT